MGAVGCVMVCNWDCNGYDDVRVGGAGGVSTLGDHCKSGCRVDYGAGIRLTTSCVRIVRDTQRVLTFVDVNKS